MRTRSTTRRSSTSAKRKLVWARQSVQTATLTAVTTVALQPLAGFESTYGADLIGCTIRRVRLTMGFRNSAAVGNGIRANVGMGVFPAAFTADPSADLHEDYMFWHQYRVEPVIATEFATLNMVEVDVRAMRKLEELQQVLFLYLRNAHPTDTLTYNYGVSTLVALP